MGCRKYLQYEKLNSQYASQYEKNRLVMRVQTLFGVGRLEAA